MRLKSRPSISVRVLLRSALVLLIGGCLTVPAGVALPAARRADVNALIAAMTLDEKIAMLVGNPIAGPADPLGRAGAGFTPGVPRLGIPPLRFADGPAGVRTAFSPSTALPAPVGLAATFSTDLAQRYGEIIGVEAQARSQDVIFGPMVNLVRVPTAGRNFETLGEDPFLQSELVASEVIGMQNEGTIATIKHYAENNQENNRQQVNVNVDEQTLHELELAPFESAVGVGAGAIMCAYNKVNGLFACENPELLTEILRDLWSFNGFVVSDYGANHGVADSINAGLDIEFLSTFLSNPVTGIKALVLNGTLPESAVDVAVRHILIMMDRFGLLENASPAGGTVVDHPRPPIDPEVGVSTARDVALTSAVLLKNDAAGGSTAFGNAGALLPLSKSDLRSLAVIGPTARSPLIGGGGSARVIPFPGSMESVLDELTQLAGRPPTFAVGTEVDGVAVPADVLAPTGGAPGDHGLLRTQTPGGATQVDQQVDYVGTNALPAIGLETTWTWTGTLTPPTTGDYTIQVQTLGGGGPPGPFSTIGSVRLDLNGDGIFQADELLGSTGGLFPTNGSLISTLDGLANSGATVHLDAGVAHSIQVTGGSGTVPLQIRLAWITPEFRQQRIDEAVDAASSARTAVVFAYNEGTEGRDRTSLSLPGIQDQLIEAVAAANERTIVVLNTGDPVTMPWVDDVPSILEMWYPGQEGAEATTDILVGKADPSGRLPVTFPVRLEDNPTFSADGRRYPGIPATGPGAQEFYDEGIFLGYRWYDQQNIEPLFAFGHGLSYASFQYSNLRVRPKKDGISVSFVVRNTGNVSGIEVPQVYLGPPENPPAPIARALVGFERIKLRPHASARVSITIDERALSYWSATDNDWVTAGGKRTVYVGSSSRDFRLTGEVNVSGH